MNENNTIITCARHPKVETGLKCATCGTPICPKCMVQTPVGAKCRECGSQKNGALFSPSPVQAISAGAVGLLLGMGAGWGVEFIGGIFSLFLAFAYGGFAGEMILRASRRKLGRLMEVIAASTLILGALGGRILVATLFMESSHAAPPMGVLRVISDLFVPSPFPAIALVVIAAAAVSRIRYV
ncbi:MAG: B-box zinc finger protein [Armatimonadota bacterium]|nr:B-box zinc finger protein [bacterium]